MANPILFLMGIVFLLGCQEYDETTSTLATNNAADPIVVDAGIVFSDCASYFCVPLSRFGVESAEDVVEITSSCECVKPSLVRYATSIHDSSDGLRCEFVTDESSSSKVTAPVNLAIAITLKKSDGTTRMMTVYFLSTQVQVKQNAGAAHLQLREHSSMFDGLPNLTMY